MKVSVPETTIATVAQVKGFSSVEVVVHRGPEEPMKIITATSTELKRSLSMLTSTPESLPSVFTEDEKREGNMSANGRR